MSIITTKEKDAAFKILCDEFKKNNYINPEYYEKFNVKRGLRNPDGTGVVAGVTLICNVHGYIVVENEYTPVDGELIYRGINIKDLVNGCKEENRFGFAETVWLLLFGTLPNKQQLDFIQNLLSQTRELPDNFAEDMIIKAPSPDIMNKMARSVLALYSYDPNPDDTSLENLIRQSMELIARLPAIMCYAYQVKRRIYNNQSMVFHPFEAHHSTAESILASLRVDRKFTDEEAKLLDLCLVLHAEHGGGNNSTFATRVLSSSGTDTYSAIAAGIGSLKGPKHGGANAKVMEMVEHAKANIAHWDNDGEVTDFLVKVLRKEAGDRSGLIYGTGHAVYTKSDPRAIILKENAIRLSKGTEFEKEFLLLDAIDRMTPEVFAKEKGNGKIISANVDLYSGLVYKMLGIPQELCTPLFAVARVAGWCAHRIEELTNAARIIRPAYKAVAKPQPYIALEDRG